MRADLRLRLAASLLAVLLGTASTGCRGEAKKAGVLTDQEREFASFFTELRLATEALAGQPEAAQLARRQILEAHGSNLTDYRRRLEDLRKDPSKWAAFWTRVEQVTDSLQTKIQGVKEGKKNVRKPD